MPKVPYACTNIKGSDVFVNRGDRIPVDKFSKEELKALYDAGSLELRDEASTDKAQTPENQTPENQAQVNQTPKNQAQVSQESTTWVPPKEETPVKKA